MGGEAKRIRRQCAHCGHAGTMYEVKLGLLDELRELRRNRDKIRRLVGGVVAAASETCQECLLWGPRGCGLELPEAGGDFAAECSAYQRKP